jgi:hypothetical protein
VVRHFLRQALPGRPVMQNGDRNVPGGKADPRGAVAWLAAAVLGVACAGWLSWFHHTPLLAPTVSEGPAAPAAAPASSPVPAL